MALIVAITVHEFSHGFMANTFGDPTAKRSGRLSLNPMAHLDPLGTIMLFIAGFGWGKPVPVNPYYLRNGARTGMALVSLAGPVSNLLCAAIFGVFARTIPPPFSDLFYYIVLYNIILAIFNLVPLPPLDGFKILLGIVPEETARNISRIERYGPAILIIVIMLDRFTGLGLFWGILRLPVNLFSNLFLGETLF
ncbi:MAG: site-2 protease family protein [Dehalococcoidia bacterium]|nr:site-2 protease family protein [Dehalococcoidia bacterium]